MKETAMMILILVGSMLVLIPMSHFIFQDKADNLAEEIQEEIIQGTTGLDMDLSPDSPEM